MQRRLTNTITVKTIRQTATPKTTGTGLARHLAQRWDLYGVLTLMASSAVYGLLALSSLA